MKQHRSGKIVRRIILVILILAILGAAGWYTYSTLRAKYTRTFIGYTATTGSISNTLSYNGKLALVSSETLTAPADAKVRAVYVQEEQAISKGDRLMLLSDGTILKAGIDGTVNQISAAEGDTVTAGTSLITLADFAHMQISVKANEYEVNSLYAGQPCTVTLASDGSSFSSSIRSIDYGNPVTMNGIAYYTVLLDAEPGEGARPGMQVTVDFRISAAENAVLLKKSALSFDDTNNAYVWKLNAAGIPEQTFVTLGVSNDNYAEIASGVASGETVYAEQKNTTTAASGLVSLLSSAFSSGATATTAPATTKQHSGDWSGEGKTHTWQGAQ